MKKAIHIILDYGHGENCPDKQSPDGSFREWAFTRDVGKEIARRLRAKGYEVHEIWTKDHEPLSTPGVTCTNAQLTAALNWRWREVNKLCAQFGSANCVCVSVHSNAAGRDGKWHNASGFCVFVGMRASANSKRLARLIYDEAARRGMQGNRYVPADHYWQQSLAMCDRTDCPAVLTECLFYDNEADLATLKSVRGREDIIQTHVEGLTKYIENL